MIMHICFLCNEYPPGQIGGIGAFTQTLGRKLVANGHEVTALGIYPSDREGVEDDQGVRVLRISHTRVPRLGFIVNGYRLRKALRQIDEQCSIDIIEGPELSLATIPRSFPGTKIIRMNGGHHFFHFTLGQRRRLWRSWLERRSFANADFLCAVSDFVAEETRRLLGLGDRPIEIVPNAVDASSFGFHSSESEEDGLILFAGTVCEKKGIRELIQAMPQIVQALPMAHLWVVGRDSRDPHNGFSFTECLRKTMDPSVAKHVIFKGAVEHSLMPQIIARAQVCVYPSHMEALPLAWLEGLSVGKAVVASRTGPGPEVIEDGVSGLLCDPHDPASIAEKVIQVLKDPTLRSRLGRKARARVVDRFSVDAVVKHNENLYRKCLDSKKRI